MKSLMHGNSISINEVTAVEKTGFWIIIEDKEYFVPFQSYPKFTNASVSSIFNMQVLSPFQLHWPDLDVDIEIAALQHPEKFPLEFK